MMRLSLIVAFVGFVAVAADRDTIPLNRKASSKSGVTDGSMIAPKAPAPGPELAKSEDEAGEDNPNAKASAYISGIDTYGSQRINEALLKETLGSDFDTWLQKGMKGDPSSMDMEVRLADKIKNKFGFAATEWSIVQYFEPGSFALNITLDVVEKEDVARRMPFLPLPTAELKDPDNLVKSWNEYEDLALDLVEKGVLEPEAEDCVAFHCPFGHVNPKLKKYEKIFVDGVRKHLTALVEIQSKDKRPEWRAAATYLLAYHKDGKKVVSLMVDRIKDPEPMVRNNALRVLGDIAEFHQDLIIPMGPVLEAIDFPRVSDRSKALYVIYSLVLGSQQARDQILKASVPALLQSLSSKQPDQKELSHGILRKISGREYASNDVQSWRSWYTKLPKMVSIRNK